MSLAVAEWNRCKAWIEGALDYVLEHTIEDIAEFVEAGDAIFWPGRNCACVTQFWEFPRSKGLNFWLAGGDMRELLNEMFPVLEAWGLEVGCTSFFVAGRPGWARAMKPMGFDPRWTVLCKEVKT